MDFKRERMRSLLGSEMGIQSSVGSTATRVICRASEGAAVWKRQSPDTKSELCSLVSSADFIPTFFSRSHKFSRPWCRSRKSTRDYASPCNIVSHERQKTGKQKVWLLSGALCYSHCHALVKIGRL